MTTPYVSPLETIYDEEGAILVALSGNVFSPLAPNPIVTPENLSSQTGPIGVATVQ